MKRLIKQKNRKITNKSNFYRAIVGLVFITVSAFVASKTNGEMLHLLTEFLFILLATLVSLVVAESLKCENFCGIAATISIICMVSRNEDDIYLYAVMRVVQTLIGIFSAMLINVFVNKKKQK